MGIRADMLPVVFDLFVQGRQGLDRSEGGLGLGLSIVKSLVTLHDGTVEAHSNGVGKGAEFVVSLPAAATTSAAASHAIAVEAGRQQGLPGRRVLVVDDNEDAAEALAEALSTWGTPSRSRTTGRRRSPSSRPSLLTSRCSTSGCR
jgi:hypothetical protein